MTGREGPAGPVISISTRIVVPCPAGISVRRVRIVPNGIRLGPSRTSWGIGAHRGRRQQERSLPMKPLLPALATVLALVAPAHADPSADRAALQALNGTFHSPAVEPGTAATAPANSSSRTDSGA
jgi:hypothetical protein